MSIQPTQETNFVEHYFTISRLTPIFEADDRLAFEALFDLGLKPNNKFLNRKSQWVSLLEVALETVAPKCLDLLLSKYHKENIHLSALAFKKAIFRGDKTSIDIFLQSPLQLQAHDHKAHFLAFLALTLHAQAPDKKAAEHTQEIFEYLFLHADLQEAENQRLDRRHFHSSLVYTCYSLNIPASFELYIQNSTIETLEKAQPLFLGYRRKSLDTNTTNSTHKTLWKPNPMLDYMDSYIEVLKDKKRLADNLCAMDLVKPQLSDTPTHKI